MNETKSADRDRLSGIIENVVWWFLIGITGAALIDRLGTDRPLTFILLIWLALFLQGVDPSVLFGRFAKTDDAA